MGFLSKVKEKARSFNDSIGINLVPTRLTDFLVPPGTPTSITNNLSKLFPGNTSDRVTSQSFTKTGFLKSDIEGFKRSGNTMASSGKVANAPGQKTITSSSQAAFGQFDEKAKQEDLETMANVFAARLKNIKDKRQRPGLLQTRGER